MTQTGLTTSALIASAGGDTTPRRLRYWRSRGLLPPLQRCAGGRAVWRHPPGTDVQLRRLLYWRARSSDLELVLIVLWVEGFPIEPGRVRGALAHFCNAWLESAATYRVDNSAELEELARNLATGRGRAALPRIVRMTAAQRVDAYAYLLALMLGLEDEAARRADGLVMLERMLGLRSGHGGGLALSVPLRADGPPSLPAPHQIADTSRAAPLQLEYARLVTDTMTTWGPLLISELAVSAGAKANAFLALAQRLFSDVPPAVYALIVVAVLSRIRALDVVDDDALAAAVALLRPGPIDLQLLDLLPISERPAVLRRLPEHRLQKIRASEPARYEASSR